MKSFYSTARFAMAIPDGVSGVDGAVIFPSGIAAHTLARRKLANFTHMSKRLLDPQLYLAQIPAALCRKTCANLASYGWFSVDGVRPYDSSEKKQNQWKRELSAKIHRLWRATLPEGDALKAAVLACVATQRSLGCSDIILPAPMITEQSDDLSVTLDWLDVGLAVAANEAPGMRCFATIALSDSALRGTKPRANQLLDVISDQVTARPFGGAYLTIEQAAESGYYCTHPNTVGALLSLVARLKQGGLSTVVVAQMGMAGFLALSAGADIWSAGWYRGERRLKRDDLDDQEGRALPHTTRIFWPVKYTWRMMLIASQRRV